MKATTYILWRGASAFDGKPIMVIATAMYTPSANPKTGWMIQIWILVEGMPPVEAMMQGEDASICGDCNLRRSECYVTTLHFTGMWKKAIREGIDISPKKFGSLARKRHLPIRLGAYGDPAMVPLWVWQHLGSMPKGSGYTHQWEWADVQFGELVMASVETLEKKEEANAKGYRTFRILDKDDVNEAVLATDEVMCPNYTQGTQCRTCGLCGGLRSKAKNVAIPMH